ncbi:CD2 antigen cytoplasmic tail-binding protein 2 homolog [Calliphora vicina]|uniref:CD2 antigen cytoplasmic tail-binding protein 2 homolog n=1 Tax=Calliphora vicina TaxID=7373 RepID=UPI00325C254D
MINNKLFQADYIYLFAIIKNMSTKRKYNIDDDDDNNLQDIHVSNKKHTLDSDEEDSDDYEKDNLGDSDIEGEEDGVSKVQDEVKITPFNMREELEEGHFDKEGNYHWNKSNDIKDNWLDNIDWVKIQKEKEISKIADGNDAADAKSMEVYNEALLYKQLLFYMNEGESVACTLKRLGKNRVKMSSVERLRLKKQGITDVNGDKITKLTELANEILTKTGNMDIYQATFESLKEKVNSIPSTSKDGVKLTDTSFDMYSDDFNKKEKDQLNKNNESVEKEATVESTSKELLWEFKWKEKDTKLHGPFHTKQMLKWSKDGYFKTGVYVRKVGELTNFYTSNRIDFDLYL